MSTVFVTSTDYTTIGGTPSTAVSKTSSLVSSITSAVQSSATSSAISSSLANPSSATPPIHFPLRDPASTDYTIVVLVLVIIIMMGVFVLLSMVILIWQCYKGYCPGCENRDRRILFLEHGDPIAAADLRDDPKVYPVVDEDGRAHESWPKIPKVIPLDDLVPSKADDIDDVDSVRSGYAPTYKLTKRGSMPRESLPRDNDTAYFNAFGIHAKDSLRVSPVSSGEKRLDYSKDGPVPRTSHFKEHFTPASSMAADEAPLTNPFDDVPLDDDNGKDSAKASNPYRFTGLRTPSWERIERIVSPWNDKSIDIDKLETQSDKMKEALAQEEAKTRRRRSGGYGGFGKSSIPGCVGNGDIELASVIKRRTGGYGCFEIPSIASIQIRKKDGGK